MPTRNRSTSNVAATNGRALAAIPTELKAMRRWVCWQSIPGDDGKKDKLPINPRTGRAASCTNPDDWTTFAEASAALRSGNYAGLMFALLPDDGFVFIDLDGCRNPVNKGIKKWAEEILRQLNSYSEISPSGTGVHVLVKGKKPGDRCRHGQVEMYDRARFATVTGRRLERYSDKIEARQADVEAVYQKHVAISQTGNDRAVPGVPIPDAKLAALLKHPKAASIYRGEQNGKYSSQSEADMALMDLAVRANWTERECRTLIETARQNAKADPKHDGYFRLTYQKARGVLTPVDLATARAKFQRWLHEPDATILDVTLAVVASSHLPGDPLWLHLVAPPSAGKTEHINAVQDWPTVYALSELTPAGLVSGRDSDDGQDHSLLPKLPGKTLAVKDFTPVIDSPKELRQKLFGRLRDAFDGSQAIHTAMVGTRAHKATFNFLTGVTNTIEKVWRNTSLGERYLLYRHPSPDALKSARQALEGAPVKDRLRVELKQAACGVLAGIDQDCVPDCSDAIRERIVRLSAMLARARTFVERSHDHQVSYLPEPEGPARIAQQLFKLGQGLALINQRPAINESDLVILNRVALDSMPLARKKLLAVFAGCRRRRVLTQTFITALGLSQSAVHEELEDLCLLRICDKQLEQAQTPPQNSYALTEDFRTLTEGIDFGTVGTARSGAEMRNSKPVQGPSKPISQIGGNRAVPTVPIVPKGV